MFPRWLWLNHVPKGMTLTREETIAVRDRVRAMGTGQRRFTDTSRRMIKNLLPIISIEVLAFLAWTYWVVQHRPSGRLMIPVTVAVIVFFQLSLWIAIAWSINRSVKPLVWKALNQIGRRTCEHCGYILEYHTFDVAHCPECGERAHPPTAPTSSENETPASIPGA